MWQHEVLVLSQESNLYTERRVQHDPPVELFNMVNCGDFFSAKLFYVCVFFSISLNSVSKIDLLFTNHCNSFNNFTCKLCFIS